MTIAELLGRIGRAFTRTFDLVMEGVFGDLLLSDLGIVVVILVVSFIVVVRLSAILLAILLYILDILGSIYEAIAPAWIAERQAKRAAPVEPESDKFGTGDWVTIGIVGAVGAILVGIVAFLGR